MPAKATTKAQAKARSRTRATSGARGSRPAPPGSRSGQRAASRPVRAARAARRQAQPTVPAPVNAVLERLGRAISAGDLPGVAACFAYPALLLTGADTHEFRDPQQVQVVFRRSLAAHGAAGIVTTHVEVEEVRALGGGVFECSVRWPAFGIDGRRIANERAHYLIQETASGTALIRVGVAVSGEDGALSSGGAVARPGSWT